MASHTFSVFRASSSFELSEAVYPADHDFIFSRFVLAICITVSNLLVTTQTNYVYP